jgi:methylated-DNA-[protein]-cysteine S-methyltransferase
MDINTKRSATMTFFTAIPSPIGSLCLTSDGTALTGLYLPTQRCNDSLWIRADDFAIFNSARNWLAKYFAGNPGAVEFPIVPAGTEFQRSVWEILLSIPYGESMSYGTIAKRLGEKQSAQAVGQAVGRNPISIIIPCHRVLGAKGQLTGYAGGLENKKWLLAHEGIAFAE